MGGKTVSLYSYDRMWQHIEKYMFQIKHIQTWFSLEYVSWWSVCIPLEFLSYIYSALGHGRWFWCLLFISSLCSSSTLPLPLKRHHNTTGTSQQGWGNFSSELLFILFFFHAINNMTTTSLSVTRTKNQKIYFVTIDTIGYLSNNCILLESLEVNGRKRVISTYESSVCEQYDTNNEAN